MIYIIGQYQGQKFGKEHFQRWDQPLDSQQVGIKHVITAVSMNRGIKVWERLLGVSGEPGINIEEYLGAGYYGGTIVLAVGSKKGVWNNEVPTKEITLFFVDSEMGFDINEITIGGNHDVQFVDMVTNVHGIYINLWFKDQLNPHPLFDTHWTTANINEPENYKLGIMWVIWSGQILDLNIIEDKVEQETLPIISNPSTQPYPEGIPANPTKKRQIMPPRRMFGYFKNMYTAFVLISDTIKLEIAP